TALTLIYGIDLLIPGWNVATHPSAPVTLRLPHFVTVPQPPSPGAPTLVTAPVSVNLHPEEIVVARGTRPDPAQRWLVEHYETTRREGKWWTLAGLWTIYTLIGSLLFTYLRRFGPTQARLLRPHIGLF